MSLVGVVGRERIEFKKIDCSNCWAITLAGPFYFFSILGIGLVSIFFPSIEVSQWIQLFVLWVLIYTVWVMRVGQKEEKEKFESKEYLEKSIDYAEKAYEIICRKDGKLTDNRVAWVSAARLIKRSFELR